MNSEKETVKILQECDSGVKMSVDALNEASQRTQNPELKNLLNKSIDEHSGIGKEINTLLNEKNAQGKEPNVIAKTMSKMKIDTQMLVNSGDETTAKLMYDGCSMGIEKLSEYVNMYPNAEQSAKNTAEKLIKCEQRLADELRQYL